jgi:acyl carrier protein
MIHTKESITHEIIKIVAHCLQIKPEEVKPASRLFMDLDAESIDILDIRFSIESQFGFKFKDDEIKSLLVSIAEERKLTAKEIPELFTVESLIEFVQYKLVGHVG